MQLDLLVSFHLGVPSRITLAVSDTRAPSNLLDSGFDERSVQLPSSRPDSELTGVTFSILKRKFMKIFDKILQHALVNPSHEAIDARIDSLDTELKHLYESLPEFYRPRPIENCIIDHPQLIVARLCISSIYYKSLCVLHRPHVTKHRGESIRECYSAPSALVTDLLQVYEECKPGGQLATEEWFMKSITWHDFLLGVTTLCLVAHPTNQTTEEFHIDQLSVQVLLQRVRAMIQTEKSEDGSRARSRALPIVEATISRLRRRRNSDGMEIMADVQASPSVTEGCSWELRDAQQNETNWAHLNELFNTSHHEIFTTSEV